MPRPPGKVATAEIEASKAAAARDQSEAGVAYLKWVEGGLMAAAHLAAIFVLYRNFRAFRFVEEQKKSDFDWWGALVGAVTGGGILGIIGGGMSKQGEGIAGWVDGLYRAMMAIAVQVLAPFITRREFVEGGVTKVENIIEPHNAVLLALLVYGVGMTAIKSGVVGQIVGSTIQALGEAVPL